MSSQSGSSQPGFSQPTPSQPGQPDSDGQEPGPLIGVEELAARLDSDEPPVVLDIRWRLAGPPGIESYLDGHLPTARFIDLDKEISGRPGAGGRHPLPESSRFETAMRIAGLHADDLAVVYDDGDSTVAARLWWTLHYFGHQRAAVLDGGFRAWARAGLRLSKVIKRPEPGDFTATAGGGMPVLDDAGAGSLARSGFLLDARVTARYTGEIEPVDRVGGHIPGAISAPTIDNVGQDGLFRDRTELIERFAALGLPAGPAGPGPAGPGPTGPGLDGDGPAPGREQEAGADQGTGAAPVVGAYCGSGVTAAHQVLALQLAGIPASLYVGSWSAWTSDPSRPVATGSSRG